MIHLATKIPHKVYVGLSGGSDSMAALDFVFNRGKREVIALNFNHGTKFGKESEIFLKLYCEKRNIPLITGKITRKRMAKESPEEYWRNERYHFFSKFSDAPIVLAHTLDDAIETWIFTSIHGNPKLIPIKSGNVIRPFITTSKKKLVNWCKKHNVPHMEDQSNFNLKYPRVRIRLNIVPSVLKINPGIGKVIRKKYLELDRRMKRK
jgi:tRNA(Ile)-lysidine synthase